MNENRIIYRKEYVQTAIELLKQAHKEIIETTERIEENIKTIMSTNEFSLVEAQDKNLKEPKVVPLLKEIETETKNNIEFLDNMSLTIEEYAKERETQATYQNPETGSKQNTSTIKNGPAIAALAGLCAVAVSAIQSKNEDKGKTEL